MIIREIHLGQIESTIKNLCIEANTSLSENVLNAFREALSQEDSLIGKEIFRQLLANATIAQNEGLAVCQDTGMVVVFMSIGQDVHLVGGSLEEAVNTGVSLGYAEGYFRASTLDPITRKTFNHNTPAVLHTEIVPGDKIKITLLPKGFGGEMMSQAIVFSPAKGIEGVKAFIINCVKEAGGKPCPPGIIGVGIGGTIEKAAILSKKALIRPIGDRNSAPNVADLEDELLEDINRLGIGPQGLGGRITALDVHIETYPTHIASIPVSVNIQCHSIRHKETII